MKGTQPHKGCKSRWRLQTDPEVEPSEQVVRARKASQGGSNRCPARRVHFGANFPATEWTVGEDLSSPANEETV